jgi:hypothetical protein
MSRPSLRTATPHCLPLDIKDSLKRDARLFALGLLALGAFALRLLLLAFGFLRGKAFWMKGTCWREIAEGRK